MAKYQAYKIDETSGDYTLENGTFVLVEDLDFVKQKLKYVVKLSKNDWFLNFDEGVTYFDNQKGLMGSRELSTLNEGEIRSIVLSVEGVLQIKEFNYTIANDEMIIELVVLTEFGEATIVEVL